MLDADKKRWESIVSRLKATAKEIEALAPTMYENLDDEDVDYVGTNLRWASEWVLDGVDQIEDSLAFIKGPEAFSAYLDQRYK